MVQNSSITSQVSKVTLAGEQADAANIPKAAHKPNGYFAFVFPLQGMSNLPRDEENELADRAKNSPELALLFNGGYIYLNEYREVVGINAIVGINAHKGLAFQGPYILSPKLRGALTADDSVTRFRPPTIDSLKKKGVAKFAWIEPGGLGSDPPIPYGAFVYLFQDESFDCYFATKGSPPDDDDDPGSPPKQPTPQPPAGRI